MMDRLAWKPPGFTGALTREPGSESGNYLILLGTLAIIDGANGFKESNYTLEFPAVGVDAVVFSIINQTVSADDFTIRGKFSEDQESIGVEQRAYYGDTSEWIHKGFYGWCSLDGFSYKWTDRKWFGIYILFAERRWNHHVAKDSLLQL